MSLPAEMCIAREASGFELAGRSTPPVRFGDQMRQNEGKRVTICDTTGRVVAQGTIRFRGDGGCEMWLTEIAAAPLAASIGPGGSTASPRILRALSVVRPPTPSSSPTP
jgi:hypothetical protein